LFARQYNTAFGVIRTLSVTAAVLFLSVGTGFAMGNAVPEAKAIADIITSSSFRPWNK
jgi:hypothetical protein